MSRGASRREGLCVGYAPIHQNPAYIERTKYYVDRYCDVMLGNSAAFGSRLDRGWVPPTIADVEAEEAEAAAKEP